MKRRPIVGADLYVELVAAAGSRCQCRGYCEASHWPTGTGTGVRRARDGRCPVTADTAVLHAVRTGDPRAPWIVLCDPCHAGQDRRAARVRQELAPVPDPLFDLRSLSVAGGWAA